MNDARRLRAAKQKRRDIRRARKRRPTENDDNVLVTTIRSALAKHPVALLDMASLLIGVLDLKDDAERADGLCKFVNTLAQLHCREATALLAVFAELILDDAALRERCRGEVSTRRDWLPRWIVDLPRVEVHRVARLPDEFGDAHELLLGLRVPGARELTLYAYLYHLGLSTLTDFILLPEPIGRVINETGREWEDMEPADVRSWLEHGLRLGPMFVLIECRPALPLLKWVIAKLPAGGRPFMPPAGDEDEVSEMLDGFFASPSGAPFRDPDYRDLLSGLCDTGCGDPSRWSIWRISSILRHPDASQYVPLEITLDAPALLRAYVPFAHAHSRIRRELTEGAIAKIDELSLGYKRQLIEQATEFGDDDVHPPTWLFPNATATSPPPAPGG
ncbi:hypothetical protein MMAD_09820 [Mycolicibacterium madagascariense]|uniref:Uncharacterized protein n=2 Tax=Mycolicibacterium madagascariense TaxID=212765 RepID=A0A7I7XCS8_9MYCO|nr:hypothetical protein MMAD_09820 [Mycolicibacterium madagascariense]